MGPSDGKGKSPIGSGVGKAEQAYGDDRDTSEVDATTPCPLLRVSCKTGTATITYNTLWLQELMEASCQGMVKFVFFGKGRQHPGRRNPRSYPRADKDAQIVIEKATGLQGDDKAGGRTRFGNEVYTLMAAYESLYCVPSGRLSVEGDCEFRDLLIIHKRRFTEAVVQGIRLANLSLENRHAGTEPGELLTYPMINAYLRPEDIAALDKRGFAPQGVARMLQALLMAVLNDLLLRAEFANEVVAREGFGSSIPAISDLGDGVRLDPGLLPPECIGLVCEALGIVDEFVPEIMGRLDAFEKTIKLLSGFGEDKLALMDQINLNLLRIVHARGDVLKYLGTLKDFDGPIPARLVIDQVIVITINDAPCLPAQVEDRKAIAPDDEGNSGYGSDSDDEFGFEELEEDRPDDDDDAAPLAGPADARPVKYKIKKVSLVSGMAAIRITSVCAEMYNSYVARQMGAAERAEPPVMTGHYFELEAGHVRVETTHANIAPNPRNASSEESMRALFDRRVCTVDVTNATINEQSDLVCKFFAARDRSGDPWQVLVLEESASKHPTGGDMVYGVVRIIGLPDAVDTLYAVYNQHLKKLNEGVRSVLSESEHGFRKMMQNMRLMPRNRDLVRAVNGRLPDSLEER